MPTEPIPSDINPFESPIKALPPSAPAESAAKNLQHDVLVTADLLVEQLRDLENLCSTVEERVQRKRRALRELEYLILTSNNTDGSPRGPACPTNTPIGSRLHLVSPRLQGLFDLHGPGLANLEAVQSCTDYSPETRPKGKPATCEDPGQLDEWVDDDDEALLCPFDDKYAIQVSPPKEKALPATPREKVMDSESRIPRKARVRRQGSASRRLTGRPLGVVARGGSYRRLGSIRSVKATNGGSELKAKGTMRRGSWKRSILENVKSRTVNSTKTVSATENERVKESGRSRKEKARKGLWSIYSVCSELGLSGTHQRLVDLE